MLQKLQTSLRGKFALLAGLAVLTGAVGFATVLPSSSASAAACHTFTPATVSYEAGLFSTATYTVPSSSGCADINVKNIQNQDPNYPNDHCAFFRVGFPRTGQPTTYSPEKFACSTGANGNLRPIALNVPNGTRYFVLYKAETMKPNNGGFYQHSFQVVD